MSENTERAAGGTRLAPGDKAPAFTLSDQDGNKVALRDFAGKTVVVYFLSLIHI